MNATNHLAGIVRRFNADGKKLSEGTRLVAPIAPKPRRIRDSIVETFPASWGSDRWSFSGIVSLVPAPYRLPGERWDLDKIMARLALPLGTPDESGVFVRSSLPALLAG